MKNLVIKYFTLKMSNVNIVGKIEQVVCDTYRFKWTIKNFCVCCDKNKFFQSSVFTTGINNENKWLLKFGAYWYIYLIDCSDVSITATIMFTIFGSDNQVFKQVNQNCILNKGNYNCFDNFISDETFNDYKCQFLPNDRLTIYCTITHNTKPVIRFQDGLSDDLKVILENEEYSDVIISIGEKEFKVHKLILMLRSPVFSAMFKHDMEEQQQNIIKVTDIDHTTMEKLLQYIYTGKVENIDDLADRLLMAAEKYALEELKSICLDVLSKNLSTDNACKMLELADQYKAKDFKSSVLDFILLHYKDMMEMPEFKIILKSPLFSLENILTLFSDLNI